MVLVPSLSFPVAELAKIRGIIHYEERLLCSVLLLDRPGLRLVYVTSAPVDPVVVDYYLGFLADPPAARRRLHLVAVGEPGHRPLTEKLLDHPQTLEEIREIVAGDAGAVLVPFNVTPAEWKLAGALGLPVDGPRPDLVALGSKTGSRRVARRAGVEVLPGEEALASLDDVMAALERLQADSGATGAVVKLNNGFSGQGNVLVTLDGMMPPEDTVPSDGKVSLAGAVRPDGVAERLPRWPATFCAAGESWPSFAAKVAAEGAIVEELVPAVASPSVQMRISPDGAVEIVSTHDQVLGGPGAQVYLGCRFPASPEYRSALQEAAWRVGHVLAAEGVVGPFGIDFLVLAGAAAPGIRLSEINLRMGGTTHPFWTAQLVTSATYDAAAGELVADGRPRCYVASDNLSAPGLAAMAPATAAAAAIATVDRAGLAYRDGAGTVLHLLGALPGFAKVGATCIAATPVEAEALFADVSAVLLSAGG